MPEELTLEQELEALKPTEKGPSSVQTPEAMVPAETAPATETPPTGETPPPAETPGIEEQLKKIEEPKETEASPLNEEQRKILDVIPNAKFAEEITGLAQGYQNFTNAFAGGDFDRVEQMFTGWNPQAYEAFLEHVYQKRVASGDWVDRWIAEKEGSPAVSGELRTLKQQIADLRSQLGQRSQQESQQETARRNAEIGQRYETHLKGLFDQINFSPSDRRWVTADIHTRVSGDMTVRQAIQNGNMAAVNKVFKEAVRDYVERDRAAQSDREKAQSQQSQHKPLVQGGAITKEGALPSDIRDVPKGKEDEWMDQELAKLAASARRK